MNFANRLIIAAGLMLGAWTVPSLAADANQLPDLAPAPAAAQAAQPPLVGDAVCTHCHDQSETKPILSIYQTPHGVHADARTPTCQACHGESKEHLAGAVGSDKRPRPDVIFGSRHTTAGYLPNDAKDQTEACLTCHKAGLRTHWSGSQHQAAGVVCANCHTVHARKDPMLTKTEQPEVCFTCHKEQRADTHKISTHPLDAGKMTCSDCHNPHGSAGPKLLKKNTVTETCFQCHADKRGPFLWEHQPVNEDCTICHTPHGSNVTPLLKSRPPFLCQECHDGPHNSKSAAAGNAAGYQGGLATKNANGTAFLYPSTQAAARGCMNCHAMVHGSNSPAGAFLHR